jgi:hypothetical protein
VSAASRTEIEMKIQLSFKRMFLEPGKTFAVPMTAGSRLRVIDGMVWATTTSDPDDHWLAAGDEHTVHNRGLTVVESVRPATIEIASPDPIGVRGRRINRYEIEIPRVACNIAAIAMTALTIGLLVVFPATTGPGRNEGTARAPSIATAVPLEQKLGEALTRFASPEGFVARPSSNDGRRIDAR